MKGNPKLLEQGKNTSNTILRFLYSHTYSTTDILLALTHLSKKGLWKQLKKLQAQGLIYCYELTNAFHGKVKLYGITVYGVHYITPEHEIPNDRKRFEPSHFRVANFQHHLDIQRLYLWAINAGYTFYSAKDFYQDNKAGDKRADAILEIKGARIAIEIERNPKTKQRYIEIITNYFREIKKGTFQRVWYLMPDEKTKTSIERLMRSIKTLTVKNDAMARSVTLTAGHWNYFEFNVHPFYACIEKNEKG